MTTKDVIKSSIYKLFAGGVQLNTYTIIILLIASAIVGCYIFFVYKNQSKAAFYSRDLNVTIAGLPIIVCAIMIAMQNNLIVSLGMVGALSIVRFRNAVKSPLDLLYCFWSISAGIICGVGLITLSVFLCTAMTGMILLMNLIPNARASSVLVVRTSSEEVDWSLVLEVLKKYSKNLKEKSRSYQSGQTEIIFELVALDANKMIKELKDFEKLEQINFLSHDGEYRI